MDSTYKKVIENIKSIRKELGISQEAIATELKMDAGNYSKLENGKQILKLTHLVNIASVLNCDITYLFTYPEKYVNEKTFHSQNKVKVVVEMELTQDEIKELDLGKRINEKLT